MTRLIQFFAPLLIMGAARAAEIQDAPIPEPNYFGIALFLVLFFGGSAWFMWRIMHQDNKDKLNKRDGSKP